MRGVAIRCEKGFRDESVERGEIGAGAVQGFPRATSRLFEIDLKRFERLRAFFRPDRALGFSEFSVKYFDFLNGFRECFLKALGESFRYTDRGIKFINSTMRGAAVSHVGTGQ